MNNFLADIILYKHCIICPTSLIRRGIKGEAVKAMLLFLFILTSLFSFSQNEKKSIKEGNELYEKKNYKEAEKNYQKAINKNKDSYKGNFNLGDTYYQQGKYEEAAQQFQALTHRATSKDTLSKAYHNLGNSLLKSKKFEESINAYKNALKNNSIDEDTRYNLAYAQQMLKQQQQNKDNKNDKKKEEKKDKEKENENKNKDNKKNEKKENKEEQKNEINKEDAQRMLDALQNDEKNIQDKLKKEKAKGVKVEIEKDW